MSKLYFYDTGLVCNLLGITSPEQLASHYLAGSIFENFVIVEMIKNRLNRGENNNLYFWRDNVGHEIDVIIDTSGQLFPLEIKSGKTITQDYFKNLLFWKKLGNTEPGKVIYAGDIEEVRSNNIVVIGWKQGVVRM